MIRRVKDLETQLRTLYRRKGHGWQDIDNLIAHLSTKGNTLGQEIKNLEQEIQRQEQGMYSAGPRKAAFWTEKPGDASPAMVLETEGGTPTVSGAQDTETVSYEADRSPPASVLRSPRKKRPTRSRMFSQVPITEDPSHGKYGSSSMEWMKHAAEVTRRKSIQAHTQGQEQYHEMTQRGREHYHEMTEQGQELYHEMTEALPGVAEGLAEAFPQAIGWLGTGLGKTAMGLARLGDRGITWLGKLGDAPDNTPPVPTMSEHYESYNSQRTEKPHTLPPNI